MLTKHTPPPPEKHPFHPPLKNNSFGLGFWLTERCSRKYPDEIFGLVAAQLLTVAVLALGWCAQAGDLPLSLASLRETVLPSSGNLAVPISLIWTVRLLLLFFLSFLQ